MILFSLILSHVLIFKPLKALNLGFATLELQGKYNGHGDYTVLCQY